MDGWKFGRGIKIGMETQGRWLGIFTAASMEMFLPAYIYFLRMKPEPAEKQMFLFALKLQAICVRDVRIEMIPGDIYSCICRTWFE